MVDSDEQFVRRVVNLDEEFIDPKILNNLDFQWVAPVLECLYE